MCAVEVNKDLIKKVAANARLNLTDEELEKFVPQIKEIIVESFSKLDSIEVDEKPSFQPIELSNKFRRDEVKPSLPIEKVFSNVSKELRKENYFKGPKVL
ncbi:MAG: Asp-tRNA(Asn)/Glu-tRNA(Gln) amidotransferase subunit GatC [Candidatus Diapherotrites archaeon]|jgi:aspartyl-tRNA(Asn)/glutamyl-tRNA(Gln) amidotransferase subunit C|uniref:Aspartyl/glutamyl-tRNA(Asn/Gln) amidotransferase subunit C n=1 Tax=Candidatus Iainarchaeum sp. TaxID=3101447 RepID=A0A7K4BZ68_9ARCH|nr:Asp-tRNA(Asn)/Glu-tRNA(Gln) amidotransferase subunit GatC [Candidatus Diapherotrites archaeon]